MRRLSQLVKKGFQMAEPQHKAAFFGTLILGFICHMTVMTHNYLTYDSLWNLYSDQNMISSGRQFLQFFCAPTSYYNLPWINGVVALFFLAFTAVIMVDLLGIKRKTVAFAAGGILATFPAITGTFSYAYTIDGYMIALFLAVLSVFLTKRFKWGFLPGILFLGLSVGVYQSYYSVAILLSVAVLLYEDLEKEFKWKEWGGRIGRFLGMGIGAYVFYVLTLKLMLALSKTELSGYQGSDKVTGMNLSSLPEGLFASVKDFVKFTLFNGVFTINPYARIVYYLLIGVTVVLFVRLFVSKKAYREWGRVLLMCLLVAVVPFGASLVAVISPDIWFHILMRMPWSVLFVFALSLFDRNLEEESVKKTWKILSVAGVLASCCMIFHFILLANVVYLNLEQRYEKTFALCARIADRLEQTEGYKTGDPVAIVGGYPNWGKYPPSEITQDVTILFFGSMGDYCAESPEKYAEFLKHYLDITIEVPSQEEQAGVTSSETFVQMPYFPEADSVRLINGIWVIKIGG